MCSGHPVVKSESVDAESEMILSRMVLEKTAAEEKEDYDMARGLKTTIEQVRTYGEQIRLCDEGKALKVKQEQYEEAKGFKIRRDDLKLKRDRAINEQLHQYGFSLEYFLNRVNSPMSVTPDQSSNNEAEYLHMEEAPSRVHYSPDKKSLEDVSVEINDERMGLNISRFF